MNPSYKRDMEHNYLILELPAKVQGNEYQIRMLVMNQIPGLLSCYMRVMDGSQAFYYEITSRQPLSRIFETARMEQKDIACLLLGIKRGIQGMKQYLLDVNYLVIHPDFIFMEPETKEVFLCCLPFYSETITEGFRELAEFVLKHLDHSDTDAVIWGYEIYNGSAKENYSLETILQGVHDRELLKEVQDTEKSVYETRKGGFDRDRHTEELEEKPVLHRKKEEEKNPQEIFAAGVQNGVYGNRKSKRKDGQDKDGSKNRYILIYGFIPAAAVVLTGAGSWFAGLGLTQTGGIVFLVLSVYLYAAKGKKVPEPKQKGKKKELGDVYTENLEPEKEIEGNSSYKETGSETGKEKIYEKYRKEVRTGHLPERMLWAKEEQIGVGYGETVALREDRELTGAMLICAEPDKHDLRRPEKILLDKECVSLGKLHGQSDAVFHLPEISRFHAQIVKRDNEYYLTDLNSKNGTFLNGVRLTGNDSMRMGEGDTVCFASLKYIFHL